MKSLLLRCQLSFPRKRESRIEILDARVRGHDVIF